MLRSGLLFVVLCGCLTTTGGARAARLPRFSDEASLRAFLLEAGRSRPPRRVERGVVNEAEGDFPYEHVVPRVVPVLSTQFDPAVEPSGPLVVQGEQVVFARERAVASAQWRDGRLGPTREWPLPAGSQTLPAAGLLRFDDGVGAIARNDCGGFDVLRPRGKDRALRVCGALAGEPWVARAGSDVVAYAAFEAITEDGAVVLPTVQRGGSPADALVALGPVYRPVEDEDDVLVRVVLRCDAAFEKCSAQSFVSARAATDAIWVDPQRVALAFALGKRRGSMACVLARGDVPPVVARTSGWAFGVVGLGDGRLSILRTREALHFAGEWKGASVAVVDPVGAVRDGVSFTAPVPTKAPGAWTWAARAGRLIYGPSRTHNLGGAVTRRVYAVSLPDGPVEAQPVEPTVDAVLFSAGEAIVLGANPKGVEYVLRRPLEASGPWTQQAYGPPWSLEHSEIERPEGAMPIEMGSRRFVVVPYPDMDHVARYRLKLLELKKDRVVDLGTFAANAERGAWKDDDRLAATAFHGRVLLRVPGELIVVDVEGPAAREVSRVPATPPR